MNCPRVSGYSLAAIIEITGIGNADFHIGMLEKAGLVRTKMSNKNEVIYETNYLWGDLLLVWLKFRKSECQKAGKRLGHYP